MRNLVKVITVNNNLIKWTIKFIIVCNFDLYSTVTEGSSDCYLADMFYQLNSLVHSRPSDRPEVAEDEAEDPSCSPMLWVSKWVDYSDKYGLGYHLCDNSVGVLYNDSTRMILQEDGQ